MKTRAVVVLGISLLLAGCGLFGGNKAPQGFTSATDYPGLADKSVAIVVYAPRATLEEYTGAREEISSFLVAKMRERMPTTRLVAPREVIYFQDDTLNWTSLTERDIGRHFSVEKVLFIQILDYSTRPIVGYGNMQGHLRAQCRIVDSSPAAVAAATPGARPDVEWKGIIDVRWPPDRPLDPTQTNEGAVRLRLLDAFAERLTQCFDTQGPTGNIPG